MSNWKIQIKKCPNGIFCEVNNSAEDISFSQVCETDNISKGLGSIMEAMLYNDIDPNEIGEVTMDIYVKKETVNRRWN